MLATSPAAFGQQGFFRPGYLVLATAPADTLRGEVDLYRAGRTQAQVQFRSQPQGPARTYDLSEVRATGDESGLRYRRCEVPRGDTKVLAMLQVLVAGPASLYQDPTGKLPATFYLDKPGQAPMPLKREQFVQVLQTTFADCPTATTTVAYMGRYLYAASELRRYVVNYNRCRYPRATVQSAYIAPIKEQVRWGAQVGVARLSIYYPYTDREEPTTGPLTPTFGLLTTLPLTNHLAFNTGFTHSSFRSADTFARPVIGTDYIRTYRYQTKGSVVRWPLAVRVTLRRPETVWRPYVQGGIQMSYILGSRLRMQTSYPDPNTPLRSVSITESMNGLGRGLHGEAGLLFRYRQALLGAGFRAESTNGYPVRGRSYLNDFDQLTFALTYYR
ncbi:outer membrane beta-barrel protein [Hymenobacter edaphi]|uniref:outer membrane beta-barrel protein n=1 Tax=Hymenobacter edaphi TaxID=2211146 RepID=UPI001A9ED750|nr:outer membrane beta-barrel protein [Hymenobacter edaphi]